MQNRKELFYLSNLPAVIPVHKCPVNSSRQLLVPVVINSLHIVILV